MSVHPTAVIDPSATLGEVTVGPFAVVGPDVTLADGVVLGSHAVVRGPATIGARTRIDSHAVIGGEPQDDRHDASVETRLVIGEDNVIREFVTIHRGSSAGRGLTVIGNRCILMSHTHVAGDSQVGDEVTLSTGAKLSGNVDVGHRAVVGAAAVVHQYCRIGRLAMVGQGAMCTQDIPPFTLAQGDRARLFGLHVVGLKRSGVSAHAVSSLKDAWRVLFTEGLPLRAALSRVQGTELSEVAELLAFVSNSQRGIARSVGRR
jgi:UDP-N-acetylglucosamine acyltransferase